MYIPDNYDAFQLHEQKQEDVHSFFPTCSWCGEKIRDDYYLINDEEVCEECIDKCRKILI